MAIINEEGQIDKSLKVADVIKRLNELDTVERRQIQEYLNKDDSKTSNEIIEAIIEAISPSNKFWWMVNANLNFVNYSPPLSGLQPIFSQTEKSKNDYYFAPNWDNAIHILHISDIHLRNKEQAEHYRFSLEIDLKYELKVDHIDYLVISGDISNYSTPEEYDAALELITKIMEEFSLNYERIIIVPGNHDLNYALSKESYLSRDGYYKFKYKDDNLSHLTEGDFIPVSDIGILLHDNEAHKQRFKNFSLFYEKIKKEPYPSEYEKQGKLYLDHKNKILFLGINSCWQIDHHHETLASINISALYNAIDQLKDKDKYGDWLKIAVWHHPVTGPEQMKNTGFLQILALAGFQICMHGHMHEALDDVQMFDTVRGLRIIGGGTFGAPLRNQQGIPLQYHLLKLNIEAHGIIVETRKKTKADGVWEPDPCYRIYGKDPTPRYYINLNNLKEFLPIKTDF